MKSNEHLYTNSDLCKLLIPIIVEQLLTCLMGTVDTMMVSNVGSAAISAVSLVDSINVLVIQALSALAAGGAILCSHYLGNNDEKSARHSARQVLLVMTVLSVVLTLFCLIFRVPLLSLVFGKVDADVMSNSQTYFLFTLLSFPFIGLYDAGASIMRSQNDSRRPMIISVSSNVLNIAGNAFLIFSLQMGVAGAAWATFAAQGAACILALILLFRRVKSMNIQGGRLFSGAALADIGKVAVPSVLQQSFISVGNLFIQYMVNGFGSSIVAGYSAAIKLNTFAITCFTTIGNGMSSFTAQNIGANKPERIKKGFRSVLVFSLATALVFFLLFFILSAPLLSLFMNEDSSQLAMDTGVQFLQIVAPFYFVVCLKLLCDGVLRGSESMGCFMAATFTDLILRVILAFILRWSMDSVTGIWISWPIAWTIATIMSVAFYKSGIWTKKLKTVPEAEKKEELAEEELVDEILEENVNMTPDK